MAVQYARLPFVTFMIIPMMTTELSSCCQNRRCMSKEIKQQTHESNSFPHFSWHTHVNRNAKQEPSRDDVHPIYGVSLRDVPGGPNPLHN
ncbi:hypothetical protein L6164_028207 [Bauhinia variegata]|uniref:Uncharacterized protein n=1 Tax=Bauhinia variegata TaxID=167791 RepID=A0ACB9LV54_BAUVA|nr:hypothetical protein L6164_028207 [Bauhinia variegata]